MGRVFFDGIVFGIQKGGGISVYFSEFAKYLARAGREFTMYAPANNNEFYAKLENKAYVRTYESRLPMLLERLRASPVEDDCTIFHSTYYRSPVQGFVGSQVVTIHDFVAERLYGGSLRSKVFARQKWRAMRDADHIVSISRFTRDELLSLYPEFSKKTISVIPNGIASEFKEHGPREYKGSAEIVYVGSRAPYKNFTPVVRALESMPDICLVVVGGGAPSKEESAMLNAAARGRWRHIAYLSNLELATLLSEAAALMYPSDMEGFGIPPVEAMSVGCPVIVKDIPVTREVCDDAARFVRDTSARELKGAIRDVLHPAKRATFVESGLKRASMYGWDKTFASICDVYDELE